MVETAAERIMHNRKAVSQPPNSNNILKRGPSNTAPNAPTPLMNPTILPGAPNISPISLAIDPAVSAKD